ncbi:MAG: hypothetical protein CL876_04380 [Dehalococcoidales bacterium]|nr:hypothetical protein [Dehalococcoidales bacterium]
MPILFFRLKYGLFKAPSVISGVPAKSWVWLAAKSSKLDDRVSNFAYSGVFSDLRASYFAWRASS